MKQIKEFVATWGIIALIVLIVVIQLAARWSACRGDIACVIIGPKYVVVQP